MNSNISNKNFIKKSFVYFIGTFSTKILGFIIIPIYAIYLNAIDLGKFDFQQTVTSFLGPIIFLAIWESVLRFGIGENKKKMSSLVTNTLFFCISVFVPFFLVLFLVYYYIYGYQLINIFYISMIMIVPIATIFQYFARAFGNNLIFMISSILSSAVNLLSLFFLVIIFKFELFGLTISFLLAQLVNIGFLFFSLKIYKYISFKYLDLSFLKELLIYSAPLVLNLSFGWFLNGFSRFYINIKIGSLENGIFAFGSKFSGIMASFASVINMSAIEDAVLTVKSDKENFIKKFESDTNGLMFFLWNLLFLAMPFVNICYKFISNVDYQSSFKIIPFLLLIAIIQGFSTLVGNLFNVLKKNKFIFVTSIIGSVATVFITFLIGVKYGILGVALSQLVGSFFVFFSRYILGKRVLNYQINWFMFIFSFIFYVIIVSVCFLTQTKLQSTFLFLIVLLVVSLVNKKRIIKIFFYFKRGN